MLRRTCVGVLAPLLPMGRWNVVASAACGTKESPMATETNFRLAGDPALLQAARDVTADNFRSGQVAALSRPCERRLTAGELDCRRPRSAFH